MNDKLPETMIDRCILASYSLSSLTRITKSEHNGHSKQLKDPDSNRVSDLLINKTIPVTPHDILLKFPETDEKFELNRERLRMTYNDNYNIDLANSSEKKLMIVFAKELFFVEKGSRKKTTTDNSLLRLLQSPAIML